MRPLLFFAALLLAMPALADTMYKCVDAQGKIAFADTPCPGSTKAATQYALAPPESREQSAARAAAEQQRLRAADAAFGVRHAQRAKEFDKEQARAARRDTLLERDAARGHKPDYNPRQTCWLTIKGKQVCQ
ncbi:MAG: DUF4124 domain-containing protein [Pseudomonadota bacterium]